MLTLRPMNKFPLANAKCGEIYCQSTTRFSILCSFCTIKIKDYNDFIKHIKTTHLTSDPNKSEECAESDSAPFVKVKVKPRDLAVCNPLDDELLTESPELLSTEIISDHEVVQPIPNCEQAISKSEEVRPKFATEGVQATSSLVLHEYISEQSPLDMSENNIEDSKGALSDDNQAMKNITKAKKTLTDQKDAIDNVTENYRPKVKKKTPKCTRTVECTQCGQEFLKSKLHAHIKKEHRNKDLEELKEPLQCQQCEEKCYTREEYYRHLLHNHGEIPCDKCDKKFVMLSKFRIHYSQHNVERNFVCNFENCNKRFNSNINLANHRVSHRTVRPFVCDQCGYSAHRLATLRVHMRIHTGEKPYICPVCQECFRSTSILASHKLKHSDARPYVCDICNAAYKGRKALLGHREVHLNLNFDCKLCGQSYKRSDALAMHMKKHKDRMC